MNSDVMLHPTVVMIIQGLDESVKKLREELATVRADEREECAKLFDNQNIWDEEVAIAIRARGTT